jgi:hypothetical protein
MAQDKIAGAVQLALNDLEQRAQQYRSMQDYGVQLMDRLASVATLSEARVPYWETVVPLVLTLNVGVEIHIHGPYPWGYSVWFDDNVNRALHFGNMPIDDVAAGIIELLATREA